MISLAFCLFQETFWQPDSIIQTLWKNIANTHGISTADWSVPFHIDVILTNRIQVLRLFVYHNSYLEHSVIKLCHVVVFVCLFLLLFICFVVAVLLMSLMIYASGYDLQDIADVSSTDVDVIVPAV